MIDLDNDEVEDDEMSFSEWSEKDGTWSESQIKENEKVERKGGQ